MNRSTVRRIWALIGADCWLARYSRFKDSLSFPIWANKWELTKTSALPARPAEALKDSLRSGVPGAAAMVAQVVLLMWLRCVQSISMAFTFASSSAALPRPQSPFPGMSSIRNIGSFHFPFYHSQDNDALPVQARCGYADGDEYTLERGRDRTLLRRAPGCAHTGETSDGR